MRKLRKIFTDNTTESVRIILRRLNFRFTDESITKLKMHPDYPSLTAISALFNSLGIENLATKMSLEELKNNISGPVLVHTIEAGGRYYIIERIDKQNIHFINERNKQETLSIDYFQRYWSGVVMLFERTTISVEPNYWSNISKKIGSLGRKKLPILFLLLIIAQALYVQIWEFNVEYFYMLLLKVIGAALMIIVISHSQDNKNSFLNHICNSPVSSGCSHMFQLLSKRIYGIISWSEIGFLYYTTFALFLILDSSQSAVILNAITSLITIIFVPYSVYYQLRIARSFCLLCSMVLVLIGIEFSVILIFKEQIFNMYSFYFPSILLLSTLVASLGYVLLNQNLNRSYIKLVNQNISLKNNLFNRDIFTALLHKGPVYKVEKVKPISIGNNLSDNVLTVINNPTCGPCTKLNRTILSFMKNNFDIRIDYIFFVPDRNSESYKLSEMIISEGLSGDQKLIQDILIDISVNEHIRLRSFNEYTQKNNLRIEDVTKILEGHNNWCLTNRIDHTPFVLYNGYPLPETYLVEEMNLWAPL